MKTRIGMMVFAIILVLMLNACAGINLGGTSAGNTNARPSVAKVGDLAPEINLKTMTGEQFVLSQMKGKIILLNFWATWCGPCREEFPAFVRKTKEYAGKDFMIVGINTQDENSDTGVQTFMRNSLVNFTIARDLDGSIAKMYRINGLPTSYFIDRNGVIRDVIVGGPIPDAKIDEEIAKLSQ